MPVQEARECKQCGREFVPTSKVNVFHSQQCRWDYSNQRTKEESQRRQETGFAWDPIRPAPNVKVSAPKMLKGNHEAHINKFFVNKGWKTAVIIPDQQFGYRRFLDTLELDPFHDPRAIEIAEQVVMAERPELSVMLGDINDLPTYGRFAQEPEFVGGVQPGLDRAAVHINVVAEYSRFLKMLKGNHDLRLETSTMANALASAGLRRARRRPNEYPVMTVEFILGLDEIPNAKMVGGYPGGAIWINDNLACIHGRITGKNLTEKVINVERVSTIFGHVHQYVDGISTFNHRNRPIFVRAHSPGCLCRIDGAVPSAKSGRDPFGRPMESWENWQQGLSVVRYQEGDGKFEIEPIRIFEGWAMHRGQEFTSAKAVNDPEYDLIPLSAGIQIQKAS